MRTALEAATALLNTLSKQTFKVHFFILTIIHLFFISSGILYLNTAKETSTISLMSTLILSIWGISILIAIILTYLFYRRMQNQISFKHDLLMQFKTFTANTIHQVRTPLSVIKIANAMIDETSHAQVKLHILSSLVSMEHLYDSLAFALQHETTDLPATTILHQRVHLFAPVASTLDTMIETTITPEISTRINQNELEYLLDNNLSNALKYGHPFKPITVSLSRSQDKLILLFESYGDKIADTHAIFERYARQDLSKQGSGIGLHIVATICERYAITIKVTYEEGKNCFYYLFPIT